VDYRLPVIAPAIACKAKEKCKLILSGASPGYLARLKTIAIP